MIIDKSHQSLTCQLLKIKMLNGPARNHCTAIPALLCGVFATHGKDLFFYFFFITFKKKLRKVVPNHEIWVPRRITSPHKAPGNYMKNIHYIWFSHQFTLTESHWCWKYSLSLHFIKNSFSISPCWPSDWQLKLSLKLLDRGRKIQNDVYINAYYCKPDLISWR